MADLDFKKQVHGLVPQHGETKPLQRRTGVEVTPYPDLQSTITQYGQATNWMSAVGSEVAARASNAIAQKIGGEIGKNPKGDIGISFTDFDKVMLQSYNTQAQATLGLQAHKLLTDANIEAASASRITPDLIAKTNQEITLGLKNIFKNAPSEIQPHLEYSYGNMQLDFSEKLTGRMIHEQKEDRRNNTALASSMYSEQAYSLGLSGNDKGGLATIENTKRLSEADVASNLMTPQQAKINVDTARQSYLFGKVTHDYEKARSEGREEAYLRSLADKKPDYLTDAEYKPVTQHLINYSNHQNSLRSQDQQLRLAHYNTTLHTDLDAAATELNELKSTVSAIQFEKVQLDYKKMLSKNNQNDYEIDNFIPEFNNVTSFYKAPNELKDKVFNRLVVAEVTNGKDEISFDDAQVKIAAMAPGPIKTFVDGLNAKASSGNPHEIETAGKQVHALYEAHAGRTLGGLTSDSKALFSKYDSLRGFMNPVDSARLATDIVYNQASKNYKENQQNWSNFVTAESRGITHSEWALSKVGFRVSDFTNPSMAHVYGTDVLDLYNTYFNALNGDSVLALKNVKREFDENYGYSYVNGKPFMTLHPVEKILGYDSQDVVPAIQMDLIEQLSPKFLPQKEMYDQGKASEYWQVIPRENIKNEALIFGKKYSPVQVQRVVRNGKTEKKEIYDIVIQGNAYNEYDISVKSDSGTVPIFQIAPYLGITTYLPNKENVDKLFSAYSFTEEPIENPFIPYAFERSLIKKNKE